MKNGMVLVTAFYVARKIIVYEGKAVSAEVIDIKRPKALAGLLVVPNVRAQMLHMQGHLIKCKVHFRGGQPIGLTKPELANQKGK